MYKLKIGLKVARNSNNNYQDIQSINFRIAYYPVKYRALRLLNYRTAQLNLFCKRGQKYSLCNELLFIVQLVVRKKR